MDTKIYILGEIDIDQVDVKRIAIEPPFGFAPDRLVFISYDDLKKTDVGALLNASKVAAIILGASPHMLPGITGAKSLSQYYRRYQQSNELPPFIDLVNASVSKAKLRVIFTHIKELMKQTAVKLPPYSQLTDDNQWVEKVKEEVIDLTDASLDTVLTEMRNTSLDLASYLERKPLNFDILMQVAVSLDRRMGKRVYSHSKKARAIYNLIIDDESSLTQPYKAEAYFRDGICLYNGRGVRRNNLRAKQRFEEAEKRGYVEATYMLYFIYKRLQAETHLENGAKLAVEKLQQAIAKGYHLAEFHLGEFNLYETKKIAIAQGNFHRYMQYCKAHKASLSNEERYRFAQCLHFGYDGKAPAIELAQREYGYLMGHDYSKAFYGMGLLALHHPTYHFEHDFHWYWTRGAQLDETRCYYALAVNEIATKGWTPISFTNLKKAMEKGYIKAVIMLIYKYWKAQQWQSIDTVLDEAHASEDMDLMFILEKYHHDHLIIPPEFEEYVTRELASHRIHGTYTQSNHIHLIIQTVAPQKVAQIKPQQPTKVSAMPTPPKTTKGTIKLASGGSLPRAKSSRR